ncbi:FkbM family methyltransferase, partial [Candidatus Omnitrophota bacterium]
MNIFIDDCFNKYFEKHPIKLIDVGASGGIQSNWKKAERYLSLIGFEPDKRSFSELKKAATAKKVYLDKALYKDKEKIDFHFTRVKTASSIFAPRQGFLRQFPESERFETQDVLKVEADRLDSQLTERGIGDIDFIKLDTNGSELYILEG